jgi:hypothetical protein
VHSLCRLSRMVLHSPVIPSPNYQSPFRIRLSWRIAHMYAGPRTVSFTTEGPSNGTKTNAFSKSVFVMLYFVRLGLNIWPETTKVNGFPVLVSNSSPSNAFIRLHISEKEGFLALIFCLSLSYVASLSIQLSNQSPPKSAKGELPTNSLCKTTPHGHESSDQKVLRL